MQEIVQSIHADAGALNHREAFEQSVEWKESMKNQIYSSP